MLQSAVNRYAEVQSKTMSKGELLLALYESLFRFLSAAAQAFEAGERARAGEQVSKAHAIISELNIALDYGKSPELCAQLGGLYEFCLDQLTDANVKQDATKVRNVSRVLTPLRDAWRLAVPKAAAEQAAR